MTTVVVIRGMPEEVIEDYLKVLRRYGIRYRVFEGKVSIRYDDLEKFLRLCDEEKNT